MKKELGISFICISGVLIIIQIIQLPKTIKNIVTLINGFGGTLEDYEIGYILGNMLGTLAILAVAAVLLFFGIRKISSK